jgi:hypothetical protein
MLIDTLEGAQSLWRRHRNRMELFPTVLVEAKFRNSEIVLVVVLVLVLDLVSFSTSK